jgi:hypothetical protein
MSGAADIVDVMTGHKGEDSIYLTHVRTQGVIHVNSLSSFKWLDPLAHDCQIAGLTLGFVLVFAALIQLANPYQVSFFRCLVRVVVMLIAGISVTLAGLFTPEMINWLVVCDRHYTLVW